VNFVVIYCLVGRSGRSSPLDVFTLSNSPVVVHGVTWCYWHLCIHQSH